MLQILISKWKDRYLLVREMPVLHRATFCIKLYFCASFTVICGTKYCGRLFHFLHRDNPVEDPGENLTGALHSNSGRLGCGGRG